MNYDCVDANGGQASSFGQSAVRMFGMPRGFDPNKKELLHPASHDEASANPHANKHTRKDLISVRDECSLTACLLFFPWQGGDLFEAESGECPE